ncbi:hypothetical protein H0I23_05230 [Cellulophaga sp. HaHaR_3_176]|uniref:hypothetical protein n=1 Tax=Cellulophaga sp. HaHaR_3_176 TaxID=1942464 RepID=UPI001C1FFE50|nr:hypothetical protein [Cellulophaga sp. HaHaR_3_176]QWX85040.1 hypothetical protein H0I23_05230 [Cellulophaga sp. HaHaR_3_176]
MFYCTNELGTAILESRPEIGLLVSVANFESLLDVKLFEHKISPVSYMYFREISILKGMMEKMNPEDRGTFNKLGNL